ncbi:MAG: hypothetical protein ACKOYN_08910 [Planctomycetota bacterium]
MHARLGVARRRERLDAEGRVAEPRNPRARPELDTRPRAVARAPQPAGRAPALDARRVKRTQELGAMHAARRRDASPAARKHRRARHLAHLDGTQLDQRRCKPIAPTTLLPRARDRVEHRIGRRAPGRSRRRERSIDRPPRGDELRGAVHLDKRHALGGGGEPTHLPRHALIARLPAFGRRDRGLERRDLGLRLGQASPLQLSRALETRELLAHAPHRARVRHGRRHA